MNVVFLDFDGVLNSSKYLLRCENCGVVLDPSRMIMLKQIVATTEAKIVLSTSWREHWSKIAADCDEIGTHINEIFSLYGLQIFDKTPNLHAGREAEIEIWLHQHPEVRNFVVLDDMLLSADFLEGHFVKTSNYYDGLDETDVEKAIGILKGGEVF